MDKKPGYWQIKAAALEYQLRLAEIEAARLAVFTAAGLDPAKRYKLLDADETITEVEAPDGA